MLTLCEKNVMTIKNKQHFKPFWSTYYKLILSIMYPNSLKSVKWEGKCFYLSYSWNQISNLSDWIKCKFYEIYFSYKVVNNIVTEYISLFT